MMEAISDEAFLLAVLNSTPVIDGVPADDLADPVRARAWLASLGGAGTGTELQHVLEARHALQAVVRGGAPAVLAPLLAGTSWIPGPDGRPDHLDAQRPGKIAGWRSALSCPGTPWPGPAPGGFVPARTTNAGSSSSITPRPAPPGGARWRPAATG